MGLDVAVYNQLKKLDKRPDDVNAFYIRCCAGDPSWLSYIAPFQEDDLLSGEEVFYKRIGSYSYYNRWRDSLAQLAGYKKRKYEYLAGVVRESACVDLWKGVVTEGIFYELINFTDCDGFLGPLTCQKLSQDFIDFQKKIDEGLIHISDVMEVRDFMDTFQTFKEAFGMVKTDHEGVFFR